MILKLRNGKILLENNTIPLNINDTIFSFDYELGTNHYTTVLHINGKKYIGLNKILDLDLNTDTVELKVELYDTNNTCMKIYTGTFKYLKLCLLGDNRLVDIYEQLKFLHEQNIMLQEKGDVI